MKDGTYWHQTAPGSKGCITTFGNFFEDFHEGDVLMHGPGVTIDPSMHHLFCAITRNHHPLHTNTAYAEGTKQGQRVVVGNLVESLALGLSVSDVSGRAIANLHMEIDFHKATFEGDTIFAESEVISVEPSSSGKPHGKVTVVMRVYAVRGKEADWKDGDDREKGVHVCTVKRTVLVPTKPQTAE